MNKKESDHTVTFGSEVPTWDGPASTQQSTTPPHTTDEIEDGYVPPVSSPAPPQASDQQHVTLDFTEESADPGKVEGKIQTAEDQKILEGQPLSDDPERKIKGWLTWFSQYFDVDTNDVLQRCLHSLYGPLKKDFYENTKEKPDLYGPFWITTTVIFLAVIASSIVKSFDKAKKDDLSELSWAVGLFYSYVFIVGLVFWGILKLYGQNDASLASVWCMYGYTMTIWVPVSILASVPITTVQLGIIIVGAIWSGLFLVFNFRSIISLTFPLNSVWAMVVQAAVHALVAVLAYFFVFKA
eukprot:TRINITY_DN7140_c0_g1_i3.p1 TRINITY_DN7140_c0_g1~~TRINITY_DN7140_c0_g1_i3.p1  ORF type:complete len:297 (-),score=35.07 TRINITY_DN7140_c0_g1_i3:394-1284(-)